MRFIAVAIATLVTIVAGQSNVYPDVISLLSNVTDLSGIWAVLSEYMDVTSQYDHYTNITVLAVSNSALANFQAVPSEFNQITNRPVVEAILQYHILQGSSTNFSTGINFAQTFMSTSTFTNVTGGQNVGIVPAIMGNPSFFSGLGTTSKVTQGPLYFKGGVVYVIDTVLQPPLDITTTAMHSDLNATSGLFNETGLTTSLENAWDVTVFAPMNAAFERIGSAISNMSLADLKALAEYHVITGGVHYSTDLQDGKQFTTSQGKNLTITKNFDGTVFVNSAKVFSFDYLLENGVLHVIDNVLNPQDTAVGFGNSSAGDIAFPGAFGNGTVPFLNVPLSTTATAPNLNSSTPASTNTASSNKGNSRGLSGGEVAAVVLGVLIGTAVLLGVAYYCLRRRGYHLKISRKSIALTPGTRVRSGLYELPPEGSATEKVELPAQQKHFPDPCETSTEATTSDGTRSPEPPEKAEKKRSVKPSPISPLSEREGIWELSGDSETRQRIERLLRPKSTPKGFI